MSFTATEKRHEKEGQFARLCAYCTKHCERFTDSQLDVALSKVNEVCLVLSDAAEEEGVDK